MKFTIIALIVFGSIGLRTCCEKTDQLNNPVLPTAKTGWQRVAITENVIIYGDFVLRKGESVNDGKYGVEAVNLFPAKCSILWRGNDDVPSAQIRIFRVNDNSTLCEFRFSRGAGRLDTVAFEPEGLIWGSIEIQDVNTVDGWVSLNLRLK